MVYIMKIASLLTIALLVILSVASSSYCQLGTFTTKSFNLLKSLGEVLINYVRDRLDGINSSETLVLTNFKYVVVGNVTLYALMEPLISELGLHPYINLVPIHTPYYANPWIFIYDRSKGLATYIELSRVRVKEFISKYLSYPNPTKLPSKVLKELILKEGTFKFNPLNLIEEGMKDPKGTWLGIVRNTSECSAFSIITVSLVWSLKAPPDLLLAAEFHNHVCPGLLSGYLIYEYLKRHGIVSNGSEVYVIAQPVWCKDDLYAILFDATPGKRRITIKLLPQDEVKELIKELHSDPAGAIIVSTNHKEVNKLVLLTFNFTKVRLMAHIPNKLLHGWGWWVRKLIEDEVMMKLIKNPDEVVKVVLIKVFKGRYHRYPKVFYDIARVGSDLYSQLGLIKAPNYTLRTYAKVLTKTVVPTNYVPITYEYSTWALLGIVVGLVSLIVILIRGKRVRS